MRKVLLSFACALVALLAFMPRTQAQGSHFPGVTRTAASCSRADVQAQVDASSDGDIVQIPNGSCAWSTGIVTTKKIWIRAQSYTPTDQGTCSRSVTITNNANTPLFDFTTGNNNHVALSGIRINEGSSFTNALEVTGNGTKVMLVSDMCFEVKERQGGSSLDTAVIGWEAQGGVIWNTRWVGIGTGGVGGVGPSGASFAVKNMPRQWITTSTMGALDTNGTVNLYIEDFSCLNVGQFPDLDDHGRAVFRHGTWDGCWGLTHGFTSLYGGRHVEFYNMLFRVSTDLRNHLGYYFWFRAGTGVFTENNVQDASLPSEFGHPDLFMIGDNTSPNGPYLIPRQPGSGHNGTNYVSDPIYEWNDTGPRAYHFGFNEQPGGWDAVVMQNRDFFANNGAKPGYTKFTYPHPLRSGAQPPQPPSAPQGLRVY